VKATITALDAVKATFTALETVMVAFTANMQGLARKGIDCSANYSF
jgi:hypothetical protein